MEPGPFDPFGSRAAREVRNALSEAFVAAWRGHAVDVPSVAAALRDRYPDPVCARWIDGRLRAYRAASRDRGGQGDPEGLDDWVGLWNRGLFFEVHELLEAHWRAARGARREALQALILAAGVFVHREAGRHTAADRLGRKAAARLVACRAQLAAIANLEQLCRNLETPGAAPPVLVRSPF